MQTVWSSCCCCYYCGWCCLCYCCSSWCLLLRALACLISAMCWLSVGANGLVTDEQRVLTSLLSNYLPSTPPRVNQSQPITIEVNFRLNQIIDLDERNQILSTNVFIDQQWNDSKLSWSSSGFSKDSKLRVSAEKIWLPDTYVFNNADSRKSGFLRSVYVLLRPDGRVSWPVPDKLRTACQVNIANFPFDQQRCIIRLGSWVHSKQQLVFVSKQQNAIDEYDYTDNSEWELLSAKPELKLRRLNTAGHFGARQSVFAEGDTEFSDLVIEFVMQRRSFFYLWNIVLPCVMLSVLTLVSFRVPPDNCEKISMGLSVFLAFSMFMLLVAEQVPATSESVPLIGLYITVLMSMTSISVIFSVCIVNLHHRGSKLRPPHRLLKLIFITWLGRWLRISQSVDAAVKQFEVADSIAYRKTADEYHHRMAKLRRQIDFLRDFMKLHKLEGELNSLWQQEADDPLSQWLCDTPQRRQQLQRFRSDCDQLPFFDSVESSPRQQQPQQQHQHQQLAQHGVEESECEAFRQLAEFRRQRHVTNSSIGVSSVVAAEWKLIALAVDKLFFLLFLLATVLVYIYLFCIFPNINSA